MTSYLGPENPKPFSVISEFYQPLLPPIVPVTHVATSSATLSATKPATVEQRLQNRDFLSETSHLMNNPYHFGSSYLDGLCELIHRYGEICVDENVCYVGPERGDIAQVLHFELHLTKPIQHVTVGKALPDPQPHNEAVNRICGGVEEYFVESAKLVDSTWIPLYDKIIVRDTLEYLKDKATFYKNAMSILNETGYMIILHRPQNCISLPYYQEALDKAKLIDLDTCGIIQDLYKLGYEVEWELEVLKAVLTRDKWLELMLGNYPNHLELMPSCDITNGLRELSEGCMKYLPTEEMVFYDRLLVIRVQHKKVKDNDVPPKRMTYMRINWMSQIGTHGVNHTKGSRPITNLIRLPITDKNRHEIPQSILHRRRRPQTSRPEWFGTVSNDTLTTLFTSRIPSRRLNRFLD